MATPKPMSDQERERLRELFWKHQEPDVSKYGDVIDALLDMLPAERLAEFVGNRTPDELPDEQATEAT